MSSYNTDQEDTKIYKVVVNHEEQYSIWPADRENPLGWNDVGKTGLKADCLAYIKEVWTDMRPLSLRKKMEEMANNPPPPAPTSDAKQPEEKSLVDRLCENEHAVEVSLRPEKTAQRFKEVIDRGYVHLKIPHTRGGTELGIRLDKDACDLSKADFESGSGTVHLQGGLVLDYVKVRYIANIDLSTLEGQGQMVKVEAAS
jgi:uncharacterized protein YbdZ (MbtH family)